MNDLQAKVHQIDKSLAAHLAECQQQNKQLWIEVRSFKRALWLCVGGGYGLMGSAIVYLAKLAFHL